MGLRRRVQQELRRELQQAQLCLEPLRLRFTPFRARRERQQLAAINALERVLESRLPEGLSAVGERLVLFSHFHPKGWLQRCIRRELTDLRERGWQVLLLTDQLNADALGWCGQQGIGWLRRRNEGRDFGAFQDGWLWLQQQGLATGLERLILLNDSVYPVLNLGASSWPRFLDHPETRCWGSVILQNGYHLQSYGLPAGCGIHSLVGGYWRTYPGWGGMRVAIRDGEIGLSALLMDHGVGLRALHPVSRCGLISPVLNCSSSCSSTARSRRRCGFKSSFWLRG